MVELLDSLLGGSGSECSWDADAPLWTLPQEADAPPPVAAPLPLGWRCICPAHGAPCARGCAPAPDEAAEVCYALVGETTGQNGVKALRALVVATPEWRDARTRLRLAAEWERSSGSRAALAAPLRACAASALRRPHLLALCRAWRLASTLWRRKPPQQAWRRPRATPQALTLPSFAAPAASLPPPVCAPNFSAWLASLGPAYESGLRPFQVVVAAVASATHLDAAHAAHFALLSRLCHRGAAVLRVQTAAAERWRAACIRDACVAPAWTALPAGGLAVESFIRLADRVSYDAFSPQQPLGGSPVEQAAAAELRASVLVCGDLDMRVLGALEQLKAAPLPDFLLALAAAASFWADWTEVWASDTNVHAAPTTCRPLGAEQPAAPGQLMCAIAEQGEAIESLMRDVERQCAALQLVP